jgi:thioesterase domain-containing protein
MASVSKNDLSIQTEAPDHAHLSERIAALAPGRIRMLARKVQEAKRTGSEVGQERTESCLVRISPGGTRPPLFLLHPVGGGVQPYYLLAQYLSSDQPVYAIQNHEFGSHQERPYASIEELAARYLDLIRPLTGDQPFYLGGWSMGGIIAFEMAQQMHREAGKTPVLLLMIDAPAQFASVPHGDDGFAHELVLLGQIWAHQKHKEFTRSAEHFQQMPPKEQLAHFVEIIKQERIVDSGADEGALQAAIKMFINNNRACERYVPRRYAGSMVVLRASEVQRETKERTHGVWKDPSFGWQAFCANTVGVHYVPGDHMFMMFEPHIQVLGATLQECMDNARPGSSGAKI